MRTGRILTAAAVLTAASLAAPAQADTIDITSGSIVVTGGYLVGDAAYDLSATGFHVTGAAIDTGGPLGCFPCAGGSSPISFGWGGDSWGHGSLTVGSATYPSAWFGGDIHMTGTALVPMSATAPFDVTFPFAVTAGSSLLGFSDSARTMPIFSAGLTGSGIATLTLTPSGSSTLFNGQALRFDFGSPAPTPEPASLLLLGGGLLAAYRARQRLTAR